MLNCKSFNDFSCPTEYIFSWAWVYHNRHWRASVLCGATNGETKQKQQMQFSSMFNERNTKRFCLIREPVTIFVLFWFIRKIKFAVHIFFSIHSLLLPTPQTDILVESIWVSFITISKFKMQSACGGHNAKHLSRLRYFRQFCKCMNPPHSLHTQIGNCWLKNWTKCVRIKILRLLWLANCIALISNEQNA